MNTATVADKSSYIRGVRMGAKVFAPSTAICEDMLGSSMRDSVVRGAGVAIAGTKGRLTDRAIR